MKTAIAYVLSVVVIPYIGNFVHLPLQLFNFTIRWPAPFFLVLPGTLLYGWLLGTAACLVFDLLGLDVSWVPLVVFMALNFLLSIKDLLTAGANYNLARTIDSSGAKAEQRGQLSVIVGFLNIYAGIIAAGIMFVGR